jgi:G3E family GTPase
MPREGPKTDASGRIPVTLVTGFLGSGKTTLINAALGAPELARTLVVVNEFGETGLDHKLFARSSDAVVVLENGCLCCTVKSDLIGTLNRMFHARQAGEIPGFDNVVIETSGLAEPGPVLQAFLSEPTLEGLYRVASVLALVDAVNWENTAREHDEWVRQIALADQIRVGKLDLVAGDRDAVEARLGAELRRLNPCAEIGLVDWTPAAVATLLTSKGFDAADPKSDPRPWLNAQAHAHDDARAHDHHDHDLLSHFDHLRERAIESFVLTREAPLSRDELQFLLDGIAQNMGTGLLRVKGLVNIAEEPGRPAVIQGVQHLLHTMSWLDQWPDSDQRTQIVFITQGIPRANLKDVIDLLDRVSVRTFKARAKGRQAMEASKPTAREP